MSRIGNMVLGARALVAVTVWLLCSATFASAAGAKSYCVASATSCPAPATAVPSFGGALTDASVDPAGSDTIYLPSGMQAQSTYHYTGSAALTIEGQGAGQTTVTGEIEDNGGSEPNITIEQLTVDVPTQDFSAGIDLTAPATVEDVAVDAPAISSGGCAICLGGGGEVESSDVSIGGAGSFGIGGSGALLLKGVDISAPGVTGGAGIFSEEGTKLVVEDSTITMPTTGTDLGVASYGTPLTLTDSTVTSGTAVEGAEAAGDVIARDTLTGAGDGETLPNTPGGGVLFDDAPDAVLEDSLIEVSGGGDDLAALCECGTAMTDYATQLTLLGDSTSDGLVAATNGANMTLDVTDSIIADPLAHSIVESTLSGATGVPKVETDYDDYDHTSAPIGYQPGASDTSAYETPGFVALPNGLFQGNYELSPTSPLLDYDTNTPLGEDVVGSSESATDLAGLSRITGGGRDLGAYQHQPVSASASASASKVGIGSWVHFSATGNIARPNDPFTYGWNFDDGATAAGQNVSHAFTTPGSHKATVTVTDQLGFKATASATVQVTARPELTTLRESHRTWAESKLKAKHRPPVGTDFSFRLGRAATVTLVFAQREQGRKVGKRCLAKATKRKRGKPCRYQERRGDLSVERSTGADTISFAGLIAKRKLPAGSYTVTVTAKAGGLSTKPQTLSFTIVN